MHILLKYSKNYQSIVIKNVTIIIVIFFIRVISKKNITNFLALMEHLIQKKPLSEPSKIQESFKNFHSI